MDIEVGVGVQVRVVPEQRLCLDTVRGGDGGHGIAGLHGVGEEGRFGRGLGLRRRLAGWALVALGLGFAGLGGRHRFRRRLGLVRRQAGGQRLHGAQSRLGGDQRQGAQVAVAVELS